MLTPLTVTAVRLPAVVGVARALDRLVQVLIERVAAVGGDNVDAIAPALLTRSRFVSGIHSA